MAGDLVSKIECQSGEKQENPSPQAVVYTCVIKIKNAEQVTSCRGRVPNFLYFSAQRTWARESYHVHVRYWKSLNVQVANKINTIFRINKYAQGDCTAQYSSAHVNDRTVQW